MPGHGSRSREGAFLSFVAAAAEEEAEGDVGVRGLREEEEGRDRTRVVQTALHRLLADDPPGPALPPGPPFLPSFPPFLPLFRRLPVPLCSVVLLQPRRRKKFVG